MVIGFCLRLACNYQSQRFIESFGFAPASRFRNSICKQLHGSRGRSALTGNFSAVPVAQARVAVAFVRISPTATLEGSRIPEGMPRHEGNGFRADTAHIVCRSTVEQSMWHCWTPACMAVTTPACVWRRGDVIHWEGTAFGPPCQAFTQFPRSLSCQFCL